MMAGESFTGVFKQVFELSMVSKMNYTKGDIEEMPPFERLAYFELIKEHFEKIQAEQEAEDLKNK